MQEEHWGWGLTALGMWHQTKFSCFTPQGLLSNTTAMDTLWGLPINHTLFNLLDPSAALARVLGWDVTLMIMLHYTRLCFSRQETPSLALKMWASVLWESLWVGHRLGLEDTSSCWVVPGWQSARVGILDIQPQEMSSANNQGSRIQKVMQPIQYLHCSFVPAQGQDPAKALLDSWPAKL